MCRLNTHMIHARYYPVYCGTIQSLRSWVHLQQPYKSIVMAAMSIAQLLGDNTDQVMEAVNSLLVFLRGTLRISGAHSVEFYTQDVWKKLVALSPDTVLSMLSQHRETSHREQRGVPDIASIFCPTSLQLVNLESLVEAAQYHSLANLEICTPIGQLLDALKMQKIVRLDKEMKTVAFMNNKKSHEVLIMSQLADCIANVCGVKQVIDLGAGKGYLSSYLSVRYDLKVYGIDSSHTNTNGANKRNRKLKKYCKAYKTDARTITTTPDSDQKKDSLLPKYTNQETEKLSISDASAADKTIQDPDTDGHSENTFSFLDILPTDAVEVPLVSESVCKDLSEQEKEQRKMENIKARKLSDSHIYSPLTSYVTAETDLHDIITDLEESIMVGLHTCGDLAPNTLRIFTAKPEIKAVCSVGCCYHLLSEEFESQEEMTAEAWGFPMSRYLKEKCWCFGRNARMSACLASERVAVGQGLPTESLFYRAVLQVICKDCYDFTRRVDTNMFKG